LSNVPLDGLGDFTPDEARVRYQHEIGPHVPPCDEVSFEKAGPREMIFFEPCKTSAAIVTCGGLCPGLNNVIRSLFLELRYNYCVNRILGIRNGYMGFNPASGLAPIELTPEFVGDIHYLGGTVLGSSRGPQDVKSIVDFLIGEQIDLVFCIGGDGTMRGAHEIHEEATRRGLKKAIVGIPKTIDNDIPYVWQTFGYATALEKAEEVLRGAHVEARGALNGIGLVKLMGRDAGFIAAGAALASQEVNFVLVPEVRFPLIGENGFLDALERRLARRGHALIAVAEGAGQHLVPQQERVRDPSGNLKPVDIGPFLRERILQHFRDRKLDVTLKYIDPSYFIRSVPANAADRILCDLMARHAAHAAMAGKTDVLVGLWDNDLTHVPISAVTKAGKKQLDTAGDQWMAVLSITGQPMWM
jgi:6-phosphofructokinase 1